MREEMLANDRTMGATGGIQALPTSTGKTRVSATSVVFASAALEQLVALQTVHQAREAAARELGLLGKVAHTHTSAGRVDQVLEYLIGAELQPVLTLESALQALGQRCMGTQETAPGTKLGFAEAVGLSETLLLPRGKL
jgi:hypothetical protein